MLALSCVCNVMSRLLVHVVIGPIKELDLAEERKKRLILTEVKVICSVGKVASSLKARQLQLRQRSTRNTFICLRVFMLLPWLSMVLPWLQNHCGTRVILFPLVKTTYPSILSFYHACVFSGCVENTQFLREIHC
jgi:hypothetical protein